MTTTTATTITITIATKTATISNNKKCTHSEKKNRMVETENERKKIPITIYMVSYFSKEE